MKSFVHVSKILFALAFIFATANLLAQTFTTLHSFASSAQYPNQAGVEPGGDLVFTNGTFYGTTSVEGNSQYGAVYSINEDGSGFKVLCSNSNSPAGGVALIGQTLYISTLGGGTKNAGAIYSVNLNGTNSNLFYSFAGSGSGAWPLTLIAVSNTLYGVTEYGSFNGAPGGNGIFYSIDTNGNNFTILHTLPAQGLSLTFKDNTFYGTTLASSGGTPGLFSANIGENNYTNFYSFSNGMFATSLFINSNQIYGVGVSNYPAQGGVIFSMNTNGSNFNILHTFTNTLSSLVLSDNLLFGSTSDGQAILFGMKTDGSNYNILYSFPATGQAFGGVSHLFGNDHSIFGTTLLGGTNNFGSFFKLNPASIIQNLNSTNGIVDMQWSAASNAIYQLQYSTNFISTNWFNFGSTVTATTSNLFFSDSATNSQRFYRLIYQP